MKIRLETANKSVEVPLNKVTLNTFEAFTNIWNETEIFDAKLLGGDEKEAVKQIFQKTDLNSFKAKYEKKIRLMKVILDMSKVKEQEILDGFESEPNSEFWQTQDLVEFATAIGHFRGLMLRS